MSASKRLRLYFIRAREPLVAYVFGLAAILGLLFFRLGSLVPGMSSSEAANLTQSQTIHQLINNPLNLPYKLVDFALVSWHHGSVFALRSVSVVFALCMIYLFYFCLHRWYAVRTAVLGTALFASSSWLLHYARLAQPDILYTSLMAALAYGVWLRQTKRNSLVIVVGGILAAFLIYIPGLVWLVILGGWWQRKALLKHYKHHTLSGLVVIATTTALLVPLIYGLALHPRLIRGLFGVQTFGIPKPLAIVQHIWNIPFQLFIRANYNPTVWLGRLPLLDIFAVVMLVLGAYAYYFLRQLDRARVLLGIIVVSLVLLGLHGGVNPLILMPFLYILVTAGIALLLQQWFTVFPLNPLARLLGTLLISITVILAVFYHVNHYFIAWPNNPATKQAFDIRQ